MTTPDQNGHLRADNAARDDAREVLGRHYSAGRLDYAEFEDRIGAAMSARTFADLRPLFADLPPPYPRSLLFGQPVEQKMPDQRWTSPLPAPLAFAPLAAPFGWEPTTGRPYSDKQRVVAGLLQVFLGCFGVGRFYTGHNGIGLAQLLITVLSLGVAAPVTVLWGLIDGILMLTGSASDTRGRPLR